MEYAIASFLQRQREELHLNKTQMAEKLSVGINQYSKYESGAMVPRSKVFNRILGALGKTEADLPQNESIVSAQPVEPEAAAPAANPVHDTPCNPMPDFRQELIVARLGAIEAKQEVLYTMMKEILNRLPER